MKKIVWLFGFFFIALSFVTTAQVNALQGFQRFKPVNGDPLDVYRQGYTHSANRLANTRIIIDYGFSNADNDTFNAGFINMHFAAIDSFSDRYIIQSYDSLHDAVSNTGYKYSDFDSVRVDSLIFTIGHENNDGLSDTLITKLVQLTAAGYPTNTVLWADTFTSGATSFTGVNNWLSIAPLLIQPKITLPSTTKFGLKLEYYGAKTDTFGYTYSFVTTGNCPAAGLNFKPAYSKFYPNSYHYMTAPFSMQLPTVAGGDIGFDCDGDTQVETAYPLQNINFIAILKGIQAAGPIGPKVRLVRVNPVTDEVTIKNFGNQAQNITTYRLCSHITYTNNLSGETLLGGSLNLNPGDTVKLKLTTINPNATGDDLGLYMNSFNFGDPANMVDYTEWKTAGNGRESVAVAKGIWGAGQFVTGNEPYKYIGNGYQDGVTYWRGVSAQPSVCDTITNVLAADSLQIFGANGGGYVSGHNFYGDVAKADSFTNTSTGDVTGALLFFAVAQYASANSSIQVSVWDNTGTSTRNTPGAPGAVIATETVKIIDIAQDITNNQPTFVAFSSPAHVTGNFYVGISFTYAAGDTVALITTADRAPNTGWEKYSATAGGGWDTYAVGWGLNLSNFIFPVLCTNGSCPTITVNATSTNAICTSVNGTASATATGGTAPYTYLWNTTQTGSTISGLAAGTYTVTASDANGCTGTKTVTVGVTNTVINLVINKTDNTSCAAANGTAAVVATGGAVPYSYIWSGGHGTTASISNLAAGPYSVSVYDANGCSATMGTILASAPPTITVSTTSTTPNTQCVNPNGAATVSASGGTPAYTYLWDAAANNQTGATASNLSGGNYTVTATDAAGCSGTGNVVVGTTTPTITVSTTSTTPSTSCAAPDGSATVSANGGAGPYTYQWNAAANNQTGATATNLGGGTYIVTATDGNGCTGSGNVTVTSTTAVITVTLVNSTANSNCTNPNGAATISVTGGTGPYTELWSGSQTGTSVTGLANGSYTITATDANSCTGVGSVTIADNRPVLGVTFATSPVTSCVNSNGSVTATVSGATGTVSYIWSTNPTQTTAMASNLAAGNYTVSAQDQTSGCTVSGSATVGTNTPAVSVSITSSNNVTSCISPNGSATATGSGGAGGFTYAWSTVPAQTNATATNLAAGNYTVVATSSNGCTASTSASISNNLATVTVDVNTTNVTSCVNANGSAVALATGGTNPYTYAWNTTGTTSTLNNLVSGVYTVTATDANGCSGSDSGTVGTSTNAPSATTTVVNETGENANDGSATVAGSGGVPPYTYAWSNGDATATADSLGDGTYDVTVTDQAGCAATATATILTVGIKLPSGVSLLSVFPNPTMDVVNIKMELTEAKSVKIEWFNVLGESVIVREFVKANVIAEQFSLNALPEGVYMARITIGSETVTNRVTVVR